MRIAAFATLTAVALTGVPASADERASLDKGVQAKSIEGSYTVEGWLPGRDRPYTGTAEVKRTGETYTVSWRIGADTIVGTGILVGDQLSVTYVRLNAPAPPGLVVFNVNQNSIGAGIWTQLGSQLVGTEQWAPSDRF